MFFISNPLITASDCDLVTIKFIFSLAGSEEVQQLKREIYIKDKVYTLAIIMSW
jgi:hypothetical protein